MKDQTCQKWFAKFSTGDFFLNNAAQVNKSEMDVNQMKTLPGNDQQYKRQPIGSENTNQTVEIFSRKWIVTTM